MTRKQAISQAIAILEKEDKNQEICQKLTEILEELPITHWSDKTIFDVFDQYVLEHNCVPSRSEIKNNPNIPTHSTIKNRFGITLEEFYLKYYPNYIKKCDSTRYHYHSFNYWLDNFKLQYVKNNYPTQSQYNKLRDQNTPCSRHIIRMSKYNNWNELLIGCGFKVKGYNKNSTIAKQRDRPKFSVNVSRSTDIDFERINNIKEQLDALRRD